MKQKHICALATLPLCMGITACASADPDMESGNSSECETTVTTTTTAQEEGFGFSAALNVFYAEDSTQALGMQAEIAEAELLSLRMLHNVVTTNRSRRQKYRCAFA